MAAVSLTTPASADAPKGAARRWEAALPVGLYGSVNLYTGRVLHTIPITGWSGRGPSIQFNLYHNQNSDWGSPGTIQGDLNGDEVIDANDIDPFIELLLQTEWTDQELKLADFNEDGVISVEDLSYLIVELENPPTAPDWRTSYSSKLVLYFEPSDPNLLAFVKLIRDDGTEDDFEAVAITTVVPPEYTFSSPPGVWDTLTADEPQDPTNGGFTLTGKHQWKAHYYKAFGAASGNERQLEWIADAARDSSGLPVNYVRCSYVTQATSPAYTRLSRVCDAKNTICDPISTGGRQLSLRYTDSDDQS
jgi:hypothetical protein